MERYKTRGMHGGKKKLNTCLALVPAGLNALATGSVTRITETQGIRLSRREAR